VTFRSRAELTSWAVEARALWLFLDYDGTLADFAPTPEHVEPDPDVIRVIERLARRPATRVTILSGRRLQHVRLLVPVGGIFLAATYGIELLAPDGAIVQRLAYEAIRPVLEAVGPEWARLIEGQQGFFLEDKGWTLAIHARFAAEEEAERVLTEAVKALDRLSLSDDFTVLTGHKFLEVAPRLARKREGVLFLLDHYPLPSARLLYIGDDDKDEDAFPVIHDRNGAAIKVRQPSQRALPTTADLCFDAPQETLRWLESLL
jgi:trehalose 6-phosphate phosphatase